MVLPLTDKNGVQQNFIPRSVPRERDTPKIALYKKLIHGPWVWLYSKKLCSVRLGYI